jgi:hypothetical protein
MKSLAIKNTLLKYESPGTYQSKIMRKVSFSKEGKTPRSKIRGSRSWYYMKGLAIRNKHVKYESPITYQSKVMSKVKVFEKVTLQGQRVKVMV